MAYFARIQNDIVQEVLAVPDSEEHRGQDFLAIDLKLGGEWIQTSYNNRIRHRFAGIGMTYDRVNDVFLWPKCHQQANLNLDSFDWDCEDVSHTQTF